MCNEGASSQGSHAHKVQQAHNIEHHMPYAKAVNTELAGLARTWEAA